MAIPRLGVRYSNMLINIENLRCSMSIGSYKFELQCWRFPRQGFAFPRNDISGGALLQNDKHQFIKRAGVCPQAPALHYAIAGTICKES